jgi:hypothetical protein
MSAIGVDSPVEFVETRVFTRRVLGLLSDEEYRLLQWALILRPDAGDVIPGAGGLRKLRWRLPGRGTRGGARLIYYLDMGSRRIFLLLMYAKNERSDLTPAERRALRALIADDLEG